MTLNTYLSYFEDLAKNTPEINHLGDDQTHRWTVMELYEILSNSSTKLDFNDFCMVSEYYSNSIQGNSMKQLSNATPVAFMLLKHVKRDDFEAKRVIEAEAEQLGMKLIKTMIAQSINGTLKGLHPNFDIKFTGPWFDNCYGVRVTFQLQQSFNYQII